MNDVVPLNFRFEEYPVRIVDRNGQPWFCAADVCAVLGINRHRDAIGHLHEDERGAIIVDTPGGPQSVAAVNQSGLWALIFRSRRAAAARLRRWVTNEVIPAIWDTGRYVVGGEHPDLNDPAVLHKLLLSHTAASLELKQRLEHIEPKARALETLTAAEGSFCITDAAKALNMRPRALFAWMERNGWIYRRPNGSHWVAYQSRIDAGLIVNRVTTLNHHQPPKVVKQPLVTAKGLAKIAEALPNTIDAGATA